MTSVDYQISIPVYIDSYAGSSKGEFDFRSGEIQGLIMFHVFHVLNLYKLIITLIPKNNIKNTTLH